MPVGLHLKPEQVGKGRERKKKILSFCFVPTQRVIENFKKIAKKFKKIKKYHYGSISSHHRLMEDEKGGKEKLSFRSVPT